MAQGGKAGRGGIDVIERALEEIMQSGIRMLRLYGQFEKLATIGGEESGGVAAAEIFAPVADSDFTKHMQIAAAGADHRNFAAEEEIEFSGKWAFRTTRAFCDGFDEAVVFGEPVDDQTGIRQAGEADDDGLSGLHGLKFGNYGNFCDGNPSK